MQKIFCKSRGKNFSKNFYKKFKKMLDRKIFLDIINEVENGMQNRNFWKFDFWKFSRIFWGSVTIMNEKDKTKGISHFKFQKLENLSSTLRSNVKNRTDTLN